jgi:hypothetical protein
VCVCVAQKIRERVKLLTRFIRTAEELRDLGNYHLLQAFIAGFSNSAVARLQWTKARLPKVSSSIHPPARSCKRFGSSVFAHGSSTCEQASATALQELEELMSMNSSFKAYRCRLNAGNPPAIPYMYASRLLTLFLSLSLFIVFVFIALLDMMIVVVFFLG